MKKIVFLALHLGYGGVEKAIANQANIMCEFYNVEIISAYKLYDVPPFYLNPNINIRYLMEEKPNKDDLKNAINERKLIKLLKEGFKAISILNKRKKLMKIAIRQSDADVIVSTRILYNDILSKCHKKNVITIAQEHRHHNNNEKYIKSLVSSVKNLDYFMPVSNELTKFYSERLKDSNVKCKYIPHNLDFWPNEFLNSNNDQLISVGRLSYEKGFIDLLDIMNILVKDLPHLKLNIIGDGDQRENIEAKIAELNSMENVILHGYQNKDYVNNMLYQSAIYVMASHEESFGIVLIEAQSFGLPCVAFDSAQGANEIINDGENGFLIKNRDSQEFSNKVRFILENESLKHDMGEQARRNSEIYKEDNVKNQWKTFYDSI